MHTIALLSLLRRGDIGRPVTATDRKVADTTIASKETLPQKKRNHHATTPKIIDTSFDAILKLILLHHIIAIVIEISK